jgi:hypothetical protein
LISARALAAAQAGQMLGQTKILPYSVFRSGFSLPADLLNHPKPCCGTAHILASVTQSFD